jgi:ribosomal protein S12 methylthiotransferase accessory factor
MDESSNKTVTRGTHRVCALQETFRRAQRWMPVMGITRIADVTGLDRIGIPVAMAYRPNARSLAVSPGKGLDILAAKTSGLMEAIEGWHAERILEPLLFASLNELRFARPVVDVAGLPRVSGATFHENLRVLWIEGDDLVGGTKRWVPFEVVHTNFASPMPQGSAAFQVSSNGLASGNHRLEAVNHAICELVERDASTLWQLRDSSARRGTRLDVGSVDDPDCVRLLEAFERADVTVGVWDMTTDVGVPAFRCTIADKNPSPLRPHLPGMGAGCHPSRAVALARALTEAAQTRLTLITGSRDDMGHAHYAASWDRTVFQRLVTEMTEPAETRGFRDCSNIENETVQEDFVWLLGRLRGVGIAQVVVVDLTKREIGIPVVRVVIPGLEGIHDGPGYLGGRRARAALGPPAV